MLSLKSGNDYLLDEKNPSGGFVRLWLFASGLFGFVFVACAIFYVWLYVQQVQNGYRLSRIWEEVELHDTVQRKLKLEWSRFQDPSLIEEMGRSRFGLAPPRADQKVTLR